MEKHSISIYLYCAYCGKHLTTLTEELDTMNETIEKEVYLENRCKYCEHLYKEDEV
jgi:DNA-directed RNA polymerase subunit RPC12/RpoP